MILKNLHKLFIFIALLFFFFFAGCSESSTGNNPDYNPPADHTVRKDGFKHKSGLRSPEENCISCHGLDLRGGETGVSCYECHGEKW